MDKLPEHAHRVFAEMFRVIGRELDESVLYKDGWFNKDSWTETDRKNFIIWLTKYFEESPEAMSEIFADHELYFSEKQHAKAFVDMFGWKTIPSARII